MLIDCHLHTSRYSPCSNLNPAAACSLAIERGLDGLVITEHQIQWTRSEVLELKRQYPDLHLFSGLEVTLAEGCDVVIITRLQDLSFPFETPLDRVLQTLASCREDSFLFLAHAFRWTDKRTPGLERVLDSMDGLEMNSVNIISRCLAGSSNRYLPRLSSLYEQVQAEWRLIPIFNSDAHAPQTVGSLATAIETSSAPADESELAGLLKRCPTREHQNLQLLQKLLG